MKRSATPVALTLIAVAGSLAAPARAVIDLPENLPAVAKNPADRLAREPIEPFRYDDASTCTPKRRRRGVEAFTAWLDKEALGVSWGTYRCERWGKGSASLHAEGRALDWHLDAAVKREAREAERIVRLLLAPDKRGEPQALARRMGVQEIIWDCGYWRQGMTAFSGIDECFTPSGRRRGDVDRTQAHMDHVHFGFTVKGANGRSSFWTR